MTAAPVPAAAAAAVNINSCHVYSNPNYQKKSDGPLPIKWLALETLNYR